jgi:hypothetical protein
MADPEPITILVLGPMQPGLDDAGNIVEDPRTAQLTRLVSAIAEDLVTTEPALGPIVVDQPDSNTSASIIPGILTKVEAADLVILDLSGGSQNVMYELGLVHAVGLPYILTTKDSGPPFYMLNIFCIGNFERLEPLDPQYNPHSLLRSRIREFLRSLRDSSGASGDPDSFATNPVTDYFQGLPVVDISAPAGLAAGYWRNAVRRFVRVGGYFDRPDRRVTFSDLLPDKTEVQRDLKIRHFVAVEPVSILAETPEEDFDLLERTLADHGFRTTKGTIHQANELDMRKFDVGFLGRIQPDGSLEIVEPGVVIDIPTTLYALQYSPRVLRIDDGPAGRPQGAAVLDRLRRRRYGNMLDRFNRIMRHFLRRGDARGHERQVHFVTLAELPALLETLVREA